ncbi:hypothetical protein [Vibrio harveyi]|uniref:hypothetical protein n=1 Tax=Vibrio harveyi TaxID=669 RepID=UPI00237FB040|nr:hypothetical protein [Vibrio harveyi]HDM8069819.1 hypothetical protein [Vibrio harveyi]
MTKNKMIKRLDWIDPKNPEQASWICTYLKAKNWGSYKEDIEGFIDPVGEFLRAAYELPENADTREGLRNMKAAWKQWEKREKNRTSKKISEGAYSISLTARKELEKLARHKKSSFSKVIEDLLVNAEGIERVQRELKKQLKKGERFGHVNVDFLSTIFSDDVVKEQAKLLTQELETQKKKQEKEHKDKQKKALATIKEKAQKISSLENEIKELKGQLLELTNKNKHLENAAKEAQDDLHGNHL